jgi:sterol desaturase/sphingolipid hydroxylase (fatty acid hydroxylase superfamily)
MTTAAGSTRGLNLILLLTFGLMLIEWLYVRLALHDADSHDLKETTTSIVTAIGNQLIRPATSFLVAFPLYFAYQHRLFEIPTTIVTLVVLFVLVDFAEYWFHRAAHRVRFMWASHAVHHSSTRFNLTAAVRLPWTGALSGAVFFFVPLTLIGFHPLAVTAMALLNLVYQFFLHTEHAPRLGPLEWVLNTPAHHRVHHASNEHCLDKNFGGIFIIWDRLFGTFAEAPRDEKLRIAKAAATYGECEQSRLYCRQASGRTPGIGSAARSLHEFVDCRFAPMRADILR